MQHIIRQSDICKGLCICVQSKVLIVITTKTMAWKLKRWDISFWQKDKTEAICHTESNKSCRHSTISLKFLDFPLLFPDIVNFPYLLIIDPKVEFILQIFLQMTIGGNFYRKEFAALH